MNNFVILKKCGKCGKLAAELVQEKLSFCPACLKLANATSNDIEVAESLRDMAAVLEVSENPDDADALSVIANVIKNLEE